MKKSKLKALFVVIISLMISATCSDKEIDPTPDPPTGEDQNGNEDTDPINPNEDIYNNYEWVDKIIPEHPRLFINQESLDEIASLIIGSERETFLTIQDRINQLVNQDIVFNDLYILDGSSSDDHKYGFRAAEAAFLYLVTKEQRYLDLTKKILDKIIEYYEIRNENKLNVEWHSFSRIHTLMAYDWVYSYLSDTEKNELGIRLFNAIKFMLPATSRSNFHGENRSGINGGFYNNQSLEWYLGLTFLGTGINDTEALEILKTGYDSHVKVLNYRKEAAGDDGGAASGTLSYALRNYPWAELNFFNTFSSATGGYNITSQYDYLVNFPNYVYWSILPKNREFGFGDAYHRDNQALVAVLNIHFTQIIQFYRDRFPEHASMTKWMVDEMFPRKNGIETENFPLARFFIDNEVNSVVAANPSQKIPAARYFEKMGQFFMRSGSGVNDTYASFTVGTNLPQHKHFDNNNFTIYKNGFLAIDTGTRPSTGLHLSHYYPRTVAHNCITVRMPGEELPAYWSYSPAEGEGNLPVPNDGGQNERNGTNVVAFDEKEEYVYIASDATASYNALKTDLVLRQFVFLPPNNFVVFDRVNSKQKEYNKRWLLHTAFKPEFNGNEFFHNFEEGRLICKTLYPENTSFELIGGPGKQFWSDGRNWSLFDGSDDQYPLYGQWRVEITPSIAQNDDVFLHLIQVGNNNPSDPKSIPSAERIEENGMKGVVFTYEDKEYKVLFATTGKAAGKISIRSNGNTILDENFSSSVKPQADLAFN